MTAAAEEEDVKQEVIAMAEKKAVRCKKMHFPTASL